MRVISLISGMIFPNKLMKSCINVVYFSLTETNFDFILETLN